MRICGFDPGSFITGYGVIDVNGNKIEVVDYGVIKIDKNLSNEDRIKEVFLSTTKIIDLFNPDICAVEEVFYWKNIKTTIYLSEVRSAIILASLLKDKPIKSFSTTLVKKSITGKGRANKKSVMYMLHSILGIKGNSQYLDATDALAVAYTCYRRMDNV